MNKKIIILIAVLAALAAIALAQNFLVQDNKLLQKQTRLWNETVDVPGTCTGQYTYTYCSNASGNGTDCRDITNTYPYSCITGQQSVQKSEEVVTDDLSSLSLTLSGKTISIPYGRDEFACTYTNTQIVCDSKEDGNGDGICRPGETCAIFELEPGRVVLNHYNSGHPSDCQDFLVNGIPFTICTDRSITATNFLEVLK